MPLHEDRARPDVADKSGWIVHLRLSAIGGDGVASAPSTHDLRRCGARELGVDAAIVFADDRHALVVLSFEAGAADPSSPTEVYGLAAEALRRLQRFRLAPLGEYVPVSAHLRRSAAA